MKKVQAITVFTAIILTMTLVFFESCMQEESCWICSSEYRINGVKDQQGRKSNIYCDFDEESAMVFEKATSFEFLDPDGNHVQINVKCNKGQ